MNFSQYRQLPPYLLSVVLCSHFIAGCNDSSEQETTSTDAVVQVTASIDSFTMQPGSDESVMLFT